jgi:hypothetical protein
MAFSLKAFNNNHTLLGKEINIGGILMKNISNIVKGALICIVIVLFIYYVKLDRELEARQAERESNKAVLIMSSEHYTYFCDTYLLSNDDGEFVFYMVGIDERFLNGDKINIHYKDEFYLVTEISVSARDGHEFMSFRTTSYTDILNSIEEATLETTEKVQLLISCLVTLNYLNYLKYDHW